MQAGVDLRAILFDIRLNLRDCSDFFPFEYDRLADPVTADSADRVNIKDKSVPEHLQPPPRYPADFSRLYTSRVLKGVLDLRDYTSDKFPVHRLNPQVTLGAEDYEIRVAIV